MSRWITPIFRMSAEPASTRQSGLPLEWFRNAAPYINAHRDRTFVVFISGEALDAPNLPSLVHDLALLDSLGIRLLLVHGSRPQIDRSLAAAAIASRYHNGLRITDSEALHHVQQATALATQRLQALLSMGVVQTPMANARIVAISGNFVIARPYGIRDGVDLGFSGHVRRIEQRTIADLLERGLVVILSNIGFSPSGEIYNLLAEEVAMEAAIALGADKLIFLFEEPLGDERELDLERIEQLLASDDTPSTLAYRLAAAAIERGVERVHLLPRATEGALLYELFTRDGIGTLVAAEVYERTLQADIEDVPGLLALLEPLEQSGVLVRRSREQLELEIDRFIVIRRDHMVIGCAALYPYGEWIELACLAIHSDYRGSARGHRLLERCEREAATRGFRGIFVLTTQTADWFRERGYAPLAIESLPGERRALYNYRRGSQAFLKRF